VAKVILGGPWAGSTSSLPAGEIAERAPQIKFRSATDSTRLNPKQRFVGFPTDGVFALNSRPQRHGGWPGRGHQGRECLVDEMMSLKVTPDNLDVVEFRRIFWQPLEPMGPLSESCRGRLADVDWAIVEDDGYPRFGAMQAIERLQVR
jgi:hypothetical protein